MILLMREVVWAVLVVQSDILYRCVGRVISILYIFVLASPKSICYAPTEHVHCTHSQCSTANDSSDTKS